MSKKESKTKKKDKRIKKSKRVKKLTVKQKQNKTIMWALILMISIILIIFLVPYIVKNYINKFEHIGLDFYKTKAGNLNFYTTKIPLVNRYGFPIGDYQISFRNNPLALENIEVNIIENKIEFEKKLPVYISIESEAPICEDNIIAVIGLTNFLDKFGNLNVKGGMDNETYAIENDQVYVTCDSNPNNTVIELRSGDKTRLRRINKNCYEIKYKDCEINQAVEKFILTITESYMKKYEKSIINN